MSDIYGRKLRKNETTTVPTEFLFVDVETEQHKQDDKIIHSLWFGYAIYMRIRKDTKKNKIEYLFFEDSDTFWKFVTGKIRKRSTLHIIAHNALFDMTVLKFRTTLTQLEYDCSFIFDEGLTFISKWAKDTKRIMILDNTNWFRGKLALWGKSLGIDKLPMPSYKENIEVWKEYCKRDTELLMHLQLFLINFIEKNDLGNWKYTIASLSFNAYRHRFMRHTIYIPEKSSETELARSSYKGGRTEAFFSGELKGDTYYKLDVNSMYPFVMRDNLYPTEVIYINSNPSLNQLKRFIERDLMIARVRINVTEPYFAYKDKDKTYYPIGRFETVLTTSELIVCIENNWIEEVIKVAGYRGERIFTDFIDFFYPMKEKAKLEENKVEEKMYKLILNSLYGKFGQRNYDDKIIGQQEEGTFITSYFIDKVTGDKGIIRQVGRNIIKSTKGGEGYNSFTAIASHVTAYARMYLYNLVLLAGRDNVYYTDTDSLVVNTEGVERLAHLLHNSKLGGLKVEDKSNYVKVLAPKHYQFGDKVVMKGIRKNADKLADNIYTQEVWPRLNKILALQEEVYYNYFITKTLTPTIKSGIISVEGKVSPYRL